MKNFFTKSKQKSKALFKWKPLIIICFLFFSIKMYGQTTVKGSVVDNKNQPLTGVNVVIKGKQVGSVSDIDGNYSITAQPSDILQFTFIGYKPEEVLVGNQSVINVVMNEDVQQINDVVVVGYGVQKKSDVTGAVSSVKSEQLQQVATTNVAQAMQGRIAGVTVTSMSGEPGSGVQVRIRGVGTINNADPLYVVDGFPVGDVSYLGPNDIESMEVLKDASATAIYGNRGANGVVLITTKKGNDKGTSVNFSMYLGTQENIKKLDVLNASEFAEAKMLAYKNAKQKMGVDTNLMKNIIATGAKGTDWQDEVLRQGYVRNYALEVSGGNDKTKYDLSAQYNSEDGIVKNSYLKQYFFRFNNQYSFSKNFKGDVSISYVNTEKSNYDYNIYTGPIPLAVRIDPISTVYDTSSSVDLTKNPKRYGYSTISEAPNPVAAIERMKTNISRGDRFVGNFGLDVNIFNGLTFTSKYGIDFNFQNPYRYFPDYEIGAKDQNHPSYLWIQHSKGLNWTNSNYLNFYKEFGKHTINLMIGEEANSTTFHKNELTVFGVPEDKFLMYATTATNPQPPFVDAVSPNDGVAVGPNNRYDWEASMLSYYGRINYSFAGKYLLTANIRRDASSKIAEKYRWGTFPSFSLGWNLKQEEFLKNSALISNLKLRAGWGKTGNQNSVSDVYSLFANITPGLWIVGPGRTQLEGKIQTVTPNEKLRWETVAQTNYGLDFGFIKNSLTGTVDLFLKKTTDMIVDPATPLFSGMAASRANVGSMENRGLELSLNYRITQGKFKAEIGANVAFLQIPKVSALSDTAQTLDRGIVSKLTPVTRTKAGETMGHFYGYKSDGLLTVSDVTDSVIINGRMSAPTYKTFKPGEYKLVDLNGDGRITPDDRVDLGSPYPDLTYGFNLNLMFIGFDLKLFVQGISGNKIVNSLDAVLKAPVEGDGNLYKSVLKGYQPGIRDNSKIPAIVQGDGVFGNFFGDYYIQDGSYIRLKNIQFGYTLPEKLTKQVKIKNMRIYFSADNLLTWTNYTGLDPENARQQFTGGVADPLTVGIDDAAYPTAKKYMVGLNVTF